MGEVLDRVRPDIAHLHNVFYQLSHSVVKPLRARGIPIVLTLHDYHPVCASNYLYYRGRICEDCKRGIHHILVNRCFRDSLAASSMAFLSMMLRTRKGAYVDQVAHVVAPSRFLVEKIAEFGVMLPRCTVLPLFYPRPLRSSRVTEPRAAVLYLGQLLEQKGVRDLLSIALETGRPFVFAGTGPLRAEIEKVARERSNVRYTGFLAADGVEEALEESLCLAVPSRWYENAPLVVLDAYAHGRPVVASAIGGIPEIVENGVTGILVPPGDRHALAAAFEYLARNPKEAAVMGAAGRALLERHHSVGTYVDSIESIYRDVVG
jgi:glycosyltransferase involved in cell wall biosynthesis